MPTERCLPSGEGAQHGRGVTPATAAEPVSEPTESGLQWHRAWYPVAPVSYLETKLPNKVTILGIAFVVWKDPEGEWRAARDECPHR